MRRRDALSSSANLIQAQHTDPTANGRSSDNNSGIYLDEPHTFFVQASAGF